MYLYGYFVLLNGPNWKVADIIPIFGVIFENLTPGVGGGGIYRVTPTVLQLILNKYHHVEVEGMRVMFQKQRMPPFNDAKYCSD